MSARATFLWMSALGLDLWGGRLGNLDPRTDPDSLGRLRVALAIHEAELRRIMVDHTDGDLRAIRQEAGP